MTTEPNKVTEAGRKLFGIGLGIILLVGGWVMGNNLVENVPAGYIAVIQSPISGQLTVHTEPGLKMQNFGSVTLYPRSGTFSFEQPVDPNDKSSQQHYRPSEDNSLKITFNDGGEAWVSGSIRYDYPLDAEQITVLHKMFSNHTNVLNGLIRTTVERSVYMSGPLMTSIDSFMSRRADLPKIIEDQARNGLYEVVTREITIEDEFTKERKTIRQADPVKDTAAPNGLRRQEESLLSRYGLNLSNFTVNNISYSQQVQQRVDALFNAASDIQIATLNAKKAEQDRRTAEEKGRADATIAEWRAKATTAEETENARKIAAVQTIEANRDKDVSVIAANRDREVAEQKVITADLYKREQVLRGEGDAEYKRLVMEADGALALKTDVYREVMDRWATAFENFKGNIVPAVVTGAGGQGQSNAFADMMGAMSVKALHDLSLDMSIIGSEQKNHPQNTQQTPGGKQNLVR